MGAHSFEQRWAGEDPQRGFDALCEEDRCSFGHDPYTGDIGQKSGFKVLSRKPVSEEEARRLAAAFTDKADKWDEVCGAIPLARRSDKVTVRTPTVRARSQEDAKTILRNKYGDDLSRIVSLEPRTSIHSGKITAVRHAVKPRIVWTVNGQGAHPNKTAAAKEARRQAKAFVVKVRAGGAGYRSDGEFFVTPQIAFDEKQGEPARSALTIRVGLFDKTATWSAKVELRKADPTTPGTWLFVGLAAS